MSALTNPSAPTPIQHPPQRVAPVAPPEPPKRRAFGKVLLVLAMLGAAGWSAYQFWLKPKAPAPPAAVVGVRTAKVVVGPLNRILRIGGQTAAREYANITAPRMRGFESRSQMELLMLIKNGAWVKKGDTLAQIDPGYLNDHIPEIQSTVAQSQTDVKKREAEQSVETENLQQTLRVNKAQVDKAKLDYSAAEVRTDVERELLKLSLDEAEARYKQSQLDIPNRKIIHEAEIKILGFTTDRHQRHVNRHMVDLKAYTIFSPMDGLVVLHSQYRGGGESYQVQQGDQLGSGQPLMKIVNPRSMLVEANVNQTESSELRIGQEVTIGLDAFPGVTLKGKIYSIGALAVGGWRQNYYIRHVPIRLTIEGTDPRLIPDLSAYGDVVIEKQERATLVPLNALSKEGGKYYVHVKQPTGFLKREVAIGSTNNVHAAVLSGLQGDEEVRLN
jgi:multidrug efflux pump subunit AcrA (membrane-fusion protein)